MMNLLAMAARISSSASEVCTSNPGRFAQECQIAINKYIEYNDIEPIKVIGADILPATGEVCLSLIGGGFDSQWEANLQDQEYSQFMIDVGSLVLNAKLAYEEGPF